MYRLDKIIQVNGVFTCFNKEYIQIEFIVRRESTKTQIREAVEKLLDVKVAKVNTKITITGKHASIRLAEGYDAEEAALKLGAF